MRTGKLLATTTPSASASASVAKSERTRKFTPKCFPRQQREREEGREGAEQAQNPHAYLCVRTWYVLHVNVCS